jgi:glycosyltransferase involved in cell wall biosynthesis
MRLSEAEDSVSTVIPTRNRPHLVGHAVRCALAQSWPPNEVVVVIDGPDPATAAELSRIVDERLRVVSLPESKGAPEARNIGVRESRGRWVAFLDDDDDWKPDKLRRQIEAARASSFPLPVVSCGLIARRDTGESVWPTRDPRPAELIGDYLFVRLFSERGEVRLQTSTLMMPRDLLLNVPWRKCVHDEWDLLLRAAAVSGVGLAFVREPLAVWNADPGRERLSHTGSWRGSFEWLRSVETLVTPQARANFMLCTLSQWAVAEGDRSAFRVLLTEAFRRGQPRPSEVLVHVARWLRPRRRRAVQPSVGAAP